MQFGRDHGDLHWIELMTPDTAKATAHYAAICGWTYQEMDMGLSEPYRLIMRGEEVIGGLMKAEDGMETQWLPYFSVEDADAAAEALVAGGGGISRPPYDLPRIGRVVTGWDATGTRVGLIAPADPAGDPPG